MVSAPRMLSEEGKLKCDTNWFVASCVSRTYHIQIEAKLQPLCMRYLELIYGMKVIVF